jgi:hypothetical protein
VIEPHHYRPSTLHMGDCAICGHIGESPHHLQYEPRRRDAGNSQGTFNMADDNSNLPQVQQRGPGNMRVQVMDAEPLYDTGQFEHMARIANMMGKASMLPDHLVVKVDADGARVPADYKGAWFVDRDATIANAFMIVNQARLFGGMDPFALAQHSYFVHGRLGFEGKLVQAVLERRLGAMEFVYSGTPGTDGYGIKVTAWVPNAEPARKESVSGTVGDWATSGRSGRNGQWVGAASQHRMLHYRGTREWARLYAPALTLGLMDDDDLEALREDYRARAAQPIANQSQPSGRIGYNPLTDDEPAPATIVRTEVAQPATVGEAVGGSEPVQAATVQADPGEAAGGDAGAGDDTSAGAADEGQAPGKGKRAPKGTPMRETNLAAHIRQAADITALRGVWANEVVPFLRELSEGGVETAGYETRLRTVHEGRRDKLREAEAKAAGADAGTGEVGGQTGAITITGQTGVEAVESDLTPPADDTFPGDLPPGQSLASAKPATDWRAFLDTFRDRLAEATTLEIVDEAIEAMLESVGKMPTDVDEATDELIAARRHAIANADKPDEAQETAKPVDHGPAPTQEELAQMVDTWKAAMRKAKSQPDLDAYNHQVIAAFMQGPHANLLSKELVEDAVTTFESRKRLLAKQSPKA